MQGNGSAREAVERAFGESGRAIDDIQDGPFKNRYKELRLVSVYKCTHG
jgi:hypothetical protein